MSLWTPGQISKPPFEAMLNMAHPLNQDLLAFFPLIPSGGYDGRSNDAGVSTNELIRNLPIFSVKDGYSTAPYTDHRSFEDCYYFNNTSQGGKFQDTTAILQVLIDLNVRSSRYSIVARAMPNTSMTASSYGLACAYVTGANQNNKLFSLDINAGRSTFVCRDSAANQITATTVAINPSVGKWYTFATLRDGKSGWSWANVGGMSAVNTNASFATVNAPVYFEVGRAFPSATLYGWLGWISYVAIYNRLLSHQELMMAHEQPWGSAYNPRFISPGFVRLDSYLSVSRRVFLNPDLRGGFREMSGGF